MIRFQTGSWWSALLVYYGGVVPKLLVPGLIYASFCTIMYVSCVQLKFEISDDGTHLLSGCGTFMLVFRLNQCYARLQMGEGLVSDLLCNLRQLVMLVCCYLEGSGIPGPLGLHYFPATSGKQPMPEDAYKAAIQTKVHVVRLVLAFAASLKFHLRMIDAWSRASNVRKETVLHILSDLVRVKSLLTREEALIIADYCGVYEEDVQENTCCACCNITSQEDAEEIGQSRRVICCNCNGSSRILVCCNGSDIGIAEGVKRYVLDFNRYRIDGEIQGLTPLFSGSGTGKHGGVALPPVIFQLVRSVLMRAVAKPGWGYPERLLNVYEVACGYVMNTYERITTLVMIPMPLPYLQHCKVLLLAFIFAFPLGRSLSHGIWGNIVVPTLVALALLGFETVAEMLENPFGDDTSDLNILEMIHVLEVEVQAIFDMSEKNGQKMFESWHALAHSLNLATSVQENNLQMPERECSFADFFQWTPIPAHTLKYILERSSSAATIHSAAYHTAGNQELISQLLRHPRAGHDSSATFRTGSSTDVSDSPQAPAIPSAASGSGWQQALIHDHFLPKYFVSLKDNSVTFRQRYSRVVEESRGRLGILRRALSTDELTT